MFIIFQKTKCLFSVLGSLLLVLIFISTDLSAYTFTPGSVIRESQEIKFRPLKGADEPEEIVYPSGSNAVGSPSTSGTAGSLSAGIGLAVVTIKGSDFKAYMLPASVTYGLNKTNDLSVSIPIGYNKIPNDKNTKGIGDLAINLSNSFLTQDEFGFGLGFGAGLVLPTGDKDIVGDKNELDISLSIKAEKKIGSNSFNLSFGYTYNDCADFSSSDYSIFNYGLSYSRGINDRFSCSVELSVPDIAARDNNFTQILFLGGRYSINDKMSATLLAGKNIGDSSLENIFISSLSYSF